MQPETRYKSFILRLWQAEGADPPGVFATLEDCQTSQRRAFATPEALCAFLAAQVDSQQPERPSGETA